MRSKYYLYILFPLLLFGKIAQADFSENDIEYQSQAIEERKFNNDKWKDIKKEINYKEETKEDIKGKSIFSSFDLAGKVMQWVLVVLFCILVLYIIFKIISGPSIKINKKLPGDDSTNKEDDIQEINLESMLTEAIQSKLFRQAVRIYYLIILRQLSIQGWINYKKDKTNNEYLQEMKPRSQFQSFQELTRIFERIYYGDKPIEELNLISIAEKQEQFLRLLKEGKTK